MAIDVSVSIIIDHTARTAHTHNAQNKNDQHLGCWHAIGCKPQRPKGLPQQQVNADGPVQPSQLSVEI
jgi:hypothetical protein